jgi:hypothetical protein
MLSKAAILSKSVESSASHPHTPHVGLMTRFLLGPGDKCEYAHRMQNTRDHTEVPVLRNIMGLDKLADGVSPPQVIVTPVSETPAAA